MSHAATDAIEVEPETLRWDEEPPSGLIQSESTGHYLLKDPFADEVCEHAVKGVLITSCGRREPVDLIDARGDAVRNPQCRHHMDTPGCAEIAERSEIHDVLIWHKNHL